MIKNFTLILLLAIGIQLQGLGQVVVTNPKFPTSESAVSISFNANQGNAGLRNCGCDVYLHTGVLTPSSTNIMDWRYVQGVWGTDMPELKMTRTGSNSFVFQIDDIREFYDVPQGEQIEAMTFVFRNVDGSQVGRAEGGSDIVVPVYQEGELVSLFTSPGSNLGVVEPGDMITFEGYVNDSATIRLENATLGEVLFESEGKVLDFTFDYTVQEQEAGAQNILLIAEDTGTERIDTNNFSYVVKVPQEIEALPEAALPGINRNEDGSITFVLEAPGKELVLFDGSFSDDWPLADNIQMKRTPDGRYFWITLEGLEEERWYVYQYLVDDQIAIADPYSELVVDAAQDPFIPESFNTYFPRPEQRQNKTYDRLTAFRVEGFPYEWEVTDFQVPETEDLFIYELLVRDFADESTYSMLIDTLDYLQRLGVNAIELMPVNEFEANDSWGYNPSYHMALDKYYGDPITFKRFIDEAHKRGMAVILDIVLNHAFSQSPLARLYWDDALFRPTPDNPWLNPVARHPFNVGYDFNHESENTQDWARIITQYWFEEYKIDGYRFDLSKGLTQRQSSDDGVFRRYDQSRVDILERLADGIWEIRPDAILILEHFAADDEEIALSDYGFLLWGNMHGAYKEAVLGFNENNKSNITRTHWRDRNWNQPNLVAYMESHDEERHLYDAREFGRQINGYNVRELGTALDRSALAHTFFWTVPGPKMIWQFGELGYDFSINYCINDGSIQQSCRTGRKPVRWDYRSNQDRLDLYFHISDLAFLKRSFPMAFRDDPVLFDVAAEEKQIQGVHSDLNFYAAGNFGVTTRSLDLTFQEGGTYYNYFSDEEITVTSGEVVTVSLAPGQGQLWINQNIERPSLTGGPLTSTNDFSISQDLKLFPNPVSSGSTITVDMQNIELKNGQVRITDTKGTTVWSQAIPENTADLPRLVIDLPQMESGLYVIELLSNERRKAFIGKVVIK